PIRKLSRKDTNLIRTNQLINVTKNWWKKTISRSKTNFDILARSRLRKVAFFIKFAFMGKKIFIGFLALFFIAVHPVSGQKKRLSFEQAWGIKPSLTTSISQYPGWVDDEHYIEVDRETKVKYSVHIRTGKKEIYTPKEENKIHVVVRDGDIYLQNDSEPAKRLTHSPAVEEQNPTLSPDYKYVAFTRENNLYTVHVDSGREVQHTIDGTNVIYNGWSSWVYYEEILGRPTKYKAFWWSPDSKQLAFMRFDDSEV